MIIERVINQIFTSNTYLLHQDGRLDYWLVDIGDIEPVTRFLTERHLSVAGVFLTHAHFDHIYGLEALVDRFPECKVYVCEYAKQALASEKLNMSKYHGTPINFTSDNVIVVREGDIMPLFAGEPELEFYETPGHNPGCLTMVLGDVIFTGDAYIPSVGVNTKLPKADKELANKSLERIMILSKEKKILSDHQVLYFHNNLN